MTFQRPDKRAVEQAPEAVRVRHEEIRPTIRSRAKAENGEVRFCDQVGIHSALPPPPRLTSGPRSVTVPM
ncbi:hypothetical protein OG930_03015 [Streptomyces sp. NBC_01799]|nr:hypothetical protein OG930_03015 [Streptomyces sp. NBC_01799]